jgi:uncharacterized protein YegP (UPF0339 family)
MKSPKLGESTLVSIENITPFGIWLYVKDKEYFLSYRDYPYFKDQTIGSILNVQLLHGFHLYWPDLDVDLETNNFENPEKYTLKYKGKKNSTAARFEIYKDKKGEFRWRLVAPNREIIADGGESYSTKQNALDVISFFKKNASKATIY